MLTRQELDQFWNDRAKNNDSPCHYMNEAMDAYAWKTRTDALQKVERLFKGKKILDIGCGDGRYTNFLYHLVDEGYAVGVDRSEMIEKAKAKFPGPQYLAGTINDTIAETAHWRWLFSEANVATLLTVYDFMTVKDRENLRKVASGMKPGSMVMILDLFPSLVPDYQKKVAYKQVETRDKKYHDWFNAGFDIEAIVPVNYMDTKLFYKLGKNKFSYWLTRLCDKVLALFSEPKYSLVVFRKL